MEWLSDLIKGREGGKYKSRKQVRGKDGKMSWAYVYDEPKDRDKDDTLLSEYNMQIVGDDVEQAKKIAKQIRKGIGKAADVCKRSPPVCADNMNIPRSEMPQLLDETFEALRKKGQGWKVDAAIKAGVPADFQGTIMAAFVKRLQDKGVKMSRETEAVGHLKATQREISAKKTFGMADAKLKGTYSPDKEPIIISKDRYILDGHHRFAAMTTIAPERRMNVVVVDMSMQDMLKTAFETPGVFRADMKDKVVPGGAPERFKKALAMLSDLVKGDVCKRKHSCDDCDDKKDCDKPRKKQSDADKKKKLFDGDDNDPEGAECENCKALSTFSDLIKGREGGKYKSRKRVRGKDGKLTWAYTYDEPKGQAKKPLETFETVEEGISRYIYMDVPELDEQLRGMKLGLSGTKEDKLVRLVSHLAGHLALLDLGGPQEIRAAKVQALEKLAEVARPKPVAPVQAPEPEPDIAPKPERVVRPPWNSSATTYEEFKRKYEESFHEMSKYTLNEVGSQIYLEQMAQLADDHPEWMGRYDRESENHFETMPELSLEPEPVIDPQAAVSTESLLLEFEKISARYKEDATTIQERTDVLGPQMAHLRKILFERGITNADEAARQERIRAMTPDEIRAQFKQLRKEIEGLQKRQLRIHSGKPEHQTRAAVTTMNANLGRLSQSVDANLALIWEMEKISGLSEKEIAEPAPEPKPDLAGDVIDGRAPEAGEWGDEGRDPQERFALLQKLIAESADSDEHTTPTGRKSKTQQQRDRKITDLVQGAATWISRMDPRLLSQSGIVRDRSADSLRGAANLLYDDSNKQTHGYRQAIRDSVVKPIQSVMLAVEQEKPKPGKWSYYVDEAVKRLLHFAEQEEQAAETQEHPEDKRRVLQRAQATRQTADALRNYHAAGKAADRDAAKSALLTHIGTKSTRIPEPVQEPEPERPAEPTTEVPSGPELVALPETEVVTAEHPGLTAWKEKYDAVAIDRHHEGDQLVFFIPAQNRWFVRDATGRNWIGSPTKEQAIALAKTKATYEEPEPIEESEAVARFAHGDKVIAEGYPGYTEVWAVGNVDDLGNRPYQLMNPETRHKLWSDGKNIRLQEPESEPAPAPIPEPEPQEIKLRGGSGYGHDGWEVGQVVRMSDKSVAAGKPRWLMVTKTSKKYIRDDGMSFGVGDDSGYLYSADARPATQEEYGPVQAEQEKQEATSVAKKELRDIHRGIKSSKNWVAGTNLPLPKGEIIPVGRQDLRLYGTGDTLILTPDYVYAMELCGADGDTWNGNFGATQRGWRVPADPELVAKIRAAGMKAVDEEKPAPADARIT